METETPLREKEKQMILKIFRLVKQSWPKDVYTPAELIKKTAEVAVVSMATVYDVIKEDKIKDQAPPPRQRKHKKNCTPKNKDQTKIDIAKVYHFLKREYEELKKRYIGLDLTRLSKFSQRTALATGISESLVIEIVQEEEKRQSTEMQQEQLRKQSLARKRSGQMESSSEEEDFESNDEQSKENRGQTKIDIAKVYHYFEQEYEALKRIYVGLGLTPLLKFCQRTALATGVSESTVVEILKEERRRNADMRQEQLRKQSLAGVKEKPLETLEMHMLAVKDEPLETYEMHMLAVKDEPLETYEEEIEILYDETAADVFGANLELADPLAADVKTEPQDENATNSNETLAVKPVDNVYKRRIQSSPFTAPGSSSPSTSRGLFTPPRQSTPPVPSTAPGPSNPPGLSTSPRQSTPPGQSTTSVTSTPRKFGNEVNQNKRQVTKSLVQSPSVEARKRQELTERKQSSQHHRDLLPEAPPRKRRAQRPSPDREPCVFVEPNTSKDLEVQEDGTVVTIQRSVSPPHIEEPTSLDVCAKVVEAGLSDIGVTDNRLDSTLQEWLQQTTNSCLSDDDYDNGDNDVLLLPTVQVRNAMTEPACDSDMTMIQAAVLQREDAANDKVLRDIVPEDCLTFNWGKDSRTFLGRRETFNSKTGPTFKVTDQTRPIDIFYKMFDSDLIDLLCTETNRYAEQHITLLRQQNKLTPSSRFYRWAPTKRDEMVTFLTVQILKGLYPLPGEQSYFAFNGFGTLKYFSRIMSFDRYYLLKTFLHFVDSQTLQDTTRLCKIRPILDYFNDKFSSLYMPSQEIAIEESLLKWHGRLSFAQKISSKAAQVGVKTYELCESSSGYLWRFFVYTGKAQPTTTGSTAGRPDEQSDRSGDDETHDGPDNDEPTDRVTTDDSGDLPTNATAKIVYDLVEPLFNRGHTIIMDNFYNSPLLCRSLKRQRTDCYGTLRLNRAFLPESVKTLDKSDLRQGEVVATYCSDLSILVWRDANIVSMISTYHNLQVETQDKYNRLTYKPKIVLDYNKSMGGVDRKDQFLASQAIERIQNKVWYKKLFRRLYYAAIFNCFLIFSGVHCKISHRQFRTVLAEELIKRHRKIDLTTESRHLNVSSHRTGQVLSTMERRVTNRRLPKPVVEHNHFPVNTHTKLAACRMRHSKRTRTSYRCEECDVPLCIVPCFKAFHKLYGQ